MGQVVGQLARQVSRLVGYLADHVAHLAGHLAHLAGQVAPKTPGAGRRRGRVPRLARRHGCRRRRAMGNGRGRGRASAALPWPDTCGTLAVIALVASILS